ncbi:MAG: hypothetical protein CL910_14770 [Deltaproteobacteria bacterium]|jgi:hypothetical protein|nr:hypothetical protein [Deltaproteobacteria bacterium]
MELDETHQAMEDVVQAFCQREIEPRIDDLESGRVSPFEIMRSMSDALDMGGLITSGAIADPVVPAILAKQLARVSPGLCLSVISNLGCGATIATRGSADLVARCGLPVLSLKKVGCWALTEPESGSDAFALKTTARIEGDEVVLNGSKAFSSNAPEAEVLLIYARLAGGEAGDKRRIFPVVVERGTPGLETGPPLEKFGMHASPTGDIFLDDVRVPRENLLGDPDRPARGTAEQTLASERIVIVAMCLGVIERCLDEAIVHARERVQFGKPIAAFQLTQQKLARIYVAQENVRNSMFALIHAQETRTVSERQVSAAKWYATEAAASAALDAMQIMGGAGYLREHAPERMFRDIKLWTVGGGTNEIQQLTIAKDLLRQHGFEIDLAGGFRVEGEGA